MCWDEIILCQVCQIRAAVESYTPHTQETKHASSAPVMLAKYWRETLDFKVKLITTTFESQYNCCHRQQSNANGRTVYPIKYTPYAWTSYGVEKPDFFIRKSGNSMPGTLVDRGSVFKRQN